jgi:hypothetical protein
MSPAAQHFPSHETELDGPAQCASARSQPPLRSVFEAAMQRAFDTAALDWCWTESKMMSRPPVCNGWHELSERSHPTAWVSGTQCSALTASFEASDGVGRALEPGCTTGGRVGGANWIRHADGLRRTCTNRTDFSCRLGVLPQRFGAWVARRRSPVSGSTLMPIP